MRRFRPIKRLRDFFYWLKCRLWHRYNVVVCESLPLTWNDRDQVGEVAHTAVEDAVAVIKMIRHYYAGRFAA